MTGWRTVANWAADREGSIHDDATARAKGFPAGLVPGDVHVALVTGALVDRFDAAWYERGWLRLTFVRPAFNGDDLRTVIEPDEADDRQVAFRLERRDGDLVCAGRAGVHAPDVEPIPPWELADAPPARAIGDRDPLPHEPIGTEYEARTPHPEQGDYDHSLVGNDECEWYRTSSPWGPPIVPTVGPFHLAHRIRPTPPPAGSPVAAEMRSGMNAGFESLHLGPMFYGRRYRRTARLVEKGTTGRYAFRTIELAFAEDDDGADGGVVRFRGRWRIKWVSPTPAR
jgi:hypothetical protein